MLAYPVRNLLSGTGSVNLVRPPLLGQELEVKSRRASDVESRMYALLNAPECLTEIETKHGRPAIDALLNKAVQISKDDSQARMGLTAQESTLFNETVACLHPDQSGTLLIAAAVAVVGMSVFLTWLYFGKHNEPTSRR